MPHLPRHYLKAIDLYFGLLSKICSPGTARALGSFSERDTGFRFWSSPHFGAWNEGYDHFDWDSSHDSNIYAKSWLQGQTFSKEIPQSERHICSDKSEYDLCFILCWLKVIFFNFCVLFWFTFSLLSIVSMWVFDISNTNTKSVSLHWIS